MKATLLLLCVLFVIQSNAPAQNCNRPLDENTFQRYKENIQSSRADRYQFREAIRITEGNCLTSSQIKSIAQLFNSDEFRLSYCVSAYRSVYDPENFYDVYDAFNTFSMAFKLHDAILGLITLPGEDYNRGDDPNEYRPDPNDDPQVIRFPDIFYPDAASYSGVLGCPAPVDDQLFVNIAYRLLEETSDDDKLNYMAGRVQVDCFTMEQAMRLATLFDNELGALAMMKTAFVHLYDLGHYQAAAVLFNIDFNRNDWMAYAEAVLSELQNPIEVVLSCEPSPQQLSQMNSSIKNQNFPREKLDLARTLVKDYCFSVEQIKGLMNQFTFSSDKLELAKITYNNCTDPESYYLLIDVMTFPSEKEELRKYIEGNRN